MAELKHYGVLGMKWGHRRERDSSGLVTKKTIIKERKQISKARRYLSEGDLKQAIDRLQMEKKLKDLTDEDIAPGRTAVKRAMTQIGKGSITAAGTAVATYAIKAAMEKKFDISEAAKFIRPKK